MTKIQNFYNTTGSKVNKTYWRAEALLHEFSLWFMPLFMIVFIFLGIAQFNYITHKNNRDYSVLTITQQNRVKELRNEIDKFYGQEARLRESFRFNEMREVSEQRLSLSKELLSLIALTPHDCWSYKFYVAIHAITPHKDL